MKPQTKAKIGAATLAVTTLFSSLGATGCPQPSGPTEKEAEKPEIRTKTIEFKRRALIFDVKYEALPSAAAPAYLDYLETRLGVVVNGEDELSVESTDYLISKGNRFNIVIGDAGPDQGIEWNIVTQSFEIREGWISTASGSDLRLGMMMGAFRTVEIAAVGSNARETVRLAKEKADVKAFADAVIAQIPQSQTAINQKILLDRALQNGHAGCLTLI